MEQIPDHPVIRSMERTGYPPRRTTARASLRRGAWERKDDDGEKVYRDPLRVP